MTDMSQMLNEDFFTKMAFNGEA